MSRGGCQSRSASLISSRIFYCDLFLTFWDRMKIFDWSVGCFSFLMFFTDLLFRCEMEKQVLGKVDGDFTNRDCESHDSQVTLMIKPNATYFITYSQVIKSSELAGGMADFQEPTVMEYNWCCNPLYSELKKKTNLRHRKLQSNDHPDQNSDRNTPDSTSWTIIFYLFITFYVASCLCCETCSNFVVDILISIQLSCAL